MTKGKKNRELPKALRDNGHKAPLHLVHRFNLEPLARHMQLSRQKYPDHVVDGKVIPNWQLGGKPDDEYIGCAMRHLDKLAKGVHTEVDDNIGRMLLHAVAVAWNMLAMITNNYDDVLSEVAEHDKENFPPKKGGDK